MRWDTIVVGGGLSGLAAAAYLGGAGKRTLLVERAHTLGGRGGSVEKDGFVFGQGLHALYRGGSAEAVLKALGVAVDGEPATAAGARVMLGGRVFAMPVGFVTLLSSGLFSFTEKIEAASVLLDIERTPLDRVPDEPLADYIERATRSPTLRALLVAVFGIATYTRNTELMSARTAIAQLRRAARPGVLYLNGGWEQLVVGLRSAALAAGVEIRTGAAADQIAHDAYVRAVVVDGQRLACDAAIMAVGPSAAKALAPAARVWDPVPMPVHASCLDLALSHLPRPEHRFVAGLDEKFFFNVQSAIARLAPSGGAQLGVIEYLAPGETGQRERLEQIVDRLQPGWREHVVHARFLPRMTVAFAHPEPGRAPSTRTDVDGLYVAGDWAGEELLVDGALGSAREAAHHVTAHAARPLEARVA
jgi:phytoene dehydrogenase-like protein